MGCSQNRAEALKELQEEIKKLIQKIIIINQFFIIIAKKLKKKKAHIFHF